MRKNIYEIINSKIDIESEYLQLYNQFYKLTEIYIPTRGNMTVYDIAEILFDSFSKKFIKRSVTISDFDNMYGFNFIPREEIPIEEFITFCEYIINICNQIQSIEHDTEPFLTTLVSNVIECMDEYNYKVIKKDEIFIFVENKAEATAVAEIVDDNLAYSTLEYNHFTMKGDLERKKSTLVKMADNIEPDRKKLNNLQLKFTDQLFNLLNKYIRHNPQNNKYISSLSNVEKESIYDDIYQMWLLAKLQLDNIERSKRISEILYKTNNELV